MSEMAIRTDQLTRDFGGTRAVDCLTLEVPRGTVFGFLGPNGAGKTTTIRMLLGLLEPTEGSAEVLGLDVATEPDGIRARCGALLEYPGVYDRLSAEENLEFVGRAYLLPPGERRARSKELLEQMGLWERREDLAGTWSRGMRQKLALCMALLSRPRLVFLDEPTAGLDVAAAAALRDDLAALAADDGVTIFLTTHNMNEAERLCSRVAVIRDGELLAVDHPDGLRARAGAARVEVVGSRFSEDALARLRERPEVSRAEARDGKLNISFAHDAPTAPLVSLLVHAGAEVEEVRRSAASLEEVFMGLMEGEQ